jgi:hypothetical protein
MPTIHKTNDYSQFRFIKKNRDISCEYLIKSIKEKNLLESNPIKVNKDLQVIDGQNRLKAAECLQVPIYYMIIDDLTEEDIPRFQIQNSWEMRDYLKYYRETIPDYEFIFKIIQKYSLQIHFVVSSCSTMISPYRAFRNGTYRITRDKEKLNQNFESFNEVNLIIKEICNVSALTSRAKEAIWSIISKKDYSHSKFLRKCDRFKSEVKAAIKFKSKNDILEGLIDNVYWKGDGDKKKKKLDREESEI